MSIPYEELSACFQGIVPALIGTCSKNGTPNVTYLSQVFYIDQKHVALSCQFFNKTKQNVMENPYAFVTLHDPLTFEAYELELRFLHEEKSGPLFEEMTARIDAIAAHVGMQGIFRLISADVYEVLAFRPVVGLLEPPVPDAAPSFAHGPGHHVTELRGLQLISERINGAVCLEEVVDTALRTLDEVFGFAHSMVLVPENEDRLVTLATHGYGQEGIGSEVAFGEGVIGTVARDRRCMHIAMSTELRYGRAVRDQARAHDVACSGLEIPLPGLPDTGSELALPLLVGDRLVGVLAIQSRSPTAFREWHEAYMRVIANLIAGAIHRASREEPESAPLTTQSRPALVTDAGRHHVFHFYKNDDAVFVDGEYLIRNLPGKILWKILNQRQQDGRTEFSNRELRLDTSLGLPPIKDNLESRLILLRKRLEQKCPDVRLVPVARGRFALELGATVELVEKDSA